MTTLARLLLDAGLIQFGWFEWNGASLPFTLHLDMLVSYPALLEQIISAALERIGALSATRLLCTYDAIPFGVAFSLRSGIPLVYSRGTDELPVFDLVGAYDIGHPALLLTNSIGWGRTVTPLISRARRVGLDVDTLVTIVEARPLPPVDDFTVLPLLRLDEVVRERVESGGLSPNHGRAVLDWIDGKQA